MHGIQPPTHRRPSRSSLSAKPWRLPTAWVALISGMLLVSCAHGLGAGSDTETVLSLQSINCPGCGAASIDALKKSPGILLAEFDAESAELKVAYDDKLTNPNEMVSVLKGIGRHAVVGDGEGFYAKDVRFPKGLDLKWLSKEGEDVDIEAHRVPNKVMVFDFYAEWCGPCKQVDAFMVPLLKSNDDVAMRKLNIVDWDSAIAKRYLKDVPNLPFVIVYGMDGERVAAVSGLDLEALRDAIDKGRR